MTKDQAIAWAAKELAREFLVSFYSDLPAAEHAAQAMTLLTGKQWVCLSRPDNDGPRIWIHEAA